ncbi:hypothetical protein OIV83_005544 [Microbotryomycetes sp. JL201]|nr:hypothetical protein OIV83_005544 [Microbotryomycetes sp. JL201]
MPSLVAAAAIPLALSAAIGGYLYPTAKLLGIGKTVVPLNNDRCQTISGLYGCEDAWIDDQHHLAYLPCTPLESRQAWLPAVLHLNSSALPAVSRDGIYLLDLNTHKHEKLKIRNMPPEALNNLNLHAIEVYQSPSDRHRLTVFVNSHRPPKDRSLGPKVGASSVIEIFETRMGDKELNWVKSVEHPLIRTPNNLVAMGERSFYVSNDHRYKVHWTRAFEQLKQVPTDIIYCDASGSSPRCSVAADNILYPNGIARGPGQLLYQASCGEGKMNVYEIQSGDNSLVLVDSVKTPHLVDNLHVARDGSITLASFPSLLKLGEVFKTAGMDSNVVSPVEVYRVTNDTSSAQYLGSKYKVEKVFADLGKTVSGATTAAPYGNKLLLTGVMTDKVVICEIPN